MWLIEAAIVGLLAAVCAALAQFVTGYSRGGCPVSFVVAVIGVFLGPMAARELGQPVIYILPIPEQEIPIVWSAVGAFGLALIVNLLTHKRRF